MKITKLQLKKIIQEEIENVLEEGELDEVAPAAVAAIRKFLGKKRTPPSWAQPGTTLQDYAAELHGQLKAKNRRRRRLVPKKIDESNIRALVEKVYDEVLAEEGWFEPHT